MAMLNEQLAAVARDTITEMREEGWDDDDIKWSASGACIKYAEAQGMIVGDEPSESELAGILALVKHFLHVPCLE